MSGIEIALIASSAVSAVGAVAQGAAASAAASSQAAAAEYNRQVAERNQVIANQNRVLALRAADQDAADQRRENRRMLSSIRATYGASGLDMAGSPLDVLGDTAMEGEVDAQRIEYAGRVEARQSALQMLGLKDDAALSAMEASAARSRAKSERFGGYLGAAGALGRGGVSLLTR